VSITFWRANVADLDKRAEIATLPIAQWLQNARLSPNGDKIAFTTCSGSCGPWDGSLWVINSDGSGLREIARGIEAADALSHSPAWSPDGQSLIYLRVVPKQLERTPHLNELHSISVDGARDKNLVTTEAMAVGIYPLGWSADGKMIYYDRSNRGRELWAVDANGERPPQRIMPLPDQYEFSPDGTKLMIYTPEEGLIILSTDGRERTAFLPPEEAFGGIWSSDGVEFIGRRGWELQLRAANVATGAARVLITAQLTGISDRLLATSPDRQWLALQSYRGGQIYLLWVGTGVRVEVTTTGSVSFVGWLARRP
jgi:dipeptidyl aminopeptidase/acylaminoacyl peptidase